MPSTGVFYVIQPMPSVPEHIKVGYSSNLSKRMQGYLSLCPQAVVIKTWPCENSTLEQEAIQAMINIGFEQIGVEVFRCYTLPDLLQFLDVFFTLSIPKPGRKWVAKQPHIQQLGQFTDLLKLLQSGKRISGTQLASHLGVDQRTIRRYITSLRGAGFSVSSDRGRFGNYWMNSDQKII